MDSRNQIGSISNKDGRITYTSVKKGVNMSILHHKEQTETRKPFMFKFLVKKTKVDTLLNFGS